MAPKARLHLPHPALSGCLFAAIERDSRGAVLGDLDRLNHFPASPLLALNFVFEGELVILPEGVDVAQAHGLTPLPPVSISGPQSRPLTSWAPGEVHALSVGIYPDAWMRLTGTGAATLLDRVVNDLPEVFCGLVRPQGGLATTWQVLQDRLLTLWRRDAAGPAGASARLADWSRSVALKAALSGPGRSLRAAERRLKSWTGQNRRALAAHERLENLHELSLAESAEPLAALAQEAGFADQSHMGRAVRRATGFSPAKLNRMIETEEAFWAYRLLGERF